MCTAAVTDVHHKLCVRLAPDECFMTALGERGYPYNFAGNPMMSKLAEGRVDAVFDIHGLAAHDVVPGAYIALRSGAVMSPSEGKPIERRDLYKMLLRPKQHVRYVLPGTEKLRLELCRALKGARTMEQIFVRSSVEPA